LLRSPDTAAYFREYPKFFWLLLFFVPLLTLVPYISLHFLAPPGSQFTGFMYASDDLETYLANMRFAQYGWKYNFIFTSEETAGGYVFLYYIALGKLAFLLNIPLIAVYHAARVLSGMLLIYAGWLCLKTLPLREEERKWAIILFCLALQFPLYDREWGLIISFPEVFPLANILLLPHIAFSQAMFLLSVYFFRQWLKEEKTVHIIQGNFTFLGLMLVHPYMLLPYAVAVLVSLYFSGKRIKPKELAGAASFFILAAPYLLYFLLLMSHPDMKEWDAQGKTIFGSFLEPVVLSYFLGLLGIAGLILIYREERKELLWLCSAPFLLIFLPFNFQERLLEGAGPFLAFAGGLTLNRIAGQFKKPAGRFLPVLFLSLPLFAALLLPAFNPPERSFLDADEVAMYEWMAENLGRDDVVLADVKHSLTIPARVGCRVWVGHHASTFRVKEKVKIMREFFTRDDFDRTPFLKNENISYVLWDTGLYELIPAETLTDVKTSGRLVLFKKR
jgi:hypothetical protein